MQNRRSFLAGTAATAALSRSAIGANDRIRLAIIGAGTRGSYVGGVFTDFPDVELVSVCDVYKPARERGPAGVVAISSWSRPTRQAFRSAWLSSTSRTWASGRSDWRSEERRRGQEGGSA